VLIIIPATMPITVPIRDTESHGMSSLRGGRLSRGIHTFIRLLQLASCIVVFVMMTFYSHG
jgi:hypothetical protein